MLSTVITYCTTTIHLGHIREAVVNLDTRSRSLVICKTGNGLLDPATMATSHEFWSKAQLLHLLQKLNIKIDVFSNKIISFLSKATKSHCIDCFIILIFKFQILKIRWFDRISVDLTERKSIFSRILYPLVGKTHMQKSTTFRTSSMDCIATMVR